MSSSEDPDDTDMAEDSSEQEFESPPETYNGPDAEGEPEADGDAEAVAAQLAATTAQAEPTTPTTLELRRGRQYQDRSIEILQNPPQFLAAMRQTLFDLGAPVELKPDEFELYWPFVDNVWVRQHKAGFDRSGKNRTDYYACRLQRPTYTPRKNERPAEAAKQRRNKKAREGGTCQMRIKTITYEGEFKKITVMRVGEHSHTHDLDAIDQLKRNTVVMDIGRTEVMKGYMPTSVFNAMRADPVKLDMVGGKFMKVNDVRNASMHWRNSHSGALQTHPDAALSRNLSVMTSRRPDGPPSYQTTTPQAQTNGEKAPVQPPPLPPDTLFFPPSSTYFLHPYLPIHSSTDPPNKPLPHVTVAYATSLDSQISLGPMIPTAISGMPSKAMTHYLRSRHDAILVGVGTAICDDPTLNCRLAGAGGYGGVGWSSHPRPVIIDPGARWEITAESKVLQAAKAGKARAPWVIVQPGASVPTARVELLQQYGGRYLTLPEVNNRFRLPWDGIFHALAQQNIRSVMIEGGGMVLNDLMGREENSRLISTVILTVAPMYLGYGGVSVVPQRKFNQVGMPVPVVRFKDVRWAPMGEDVVMCARITRDIPPQLPDGQPALPSGMMQTGPSLPSGQGTPAMQGTPGMSSMPGVHITLSTPSVQGTTAAPQFARGPRGQQPGQQSGQQTPAQSQDAAAAAAAGSSAPTPNMTSGKAAAGTPASAPAPVMSGSLGGTPQTPTPVGLPIGQMGQMSVPATFVPSAPFVPMHIAGGAMTAQAQAQEELRRRMQAHARGQP